MKRISIFSAATSLAITSNSNNWSVVAFSTPNSRKIQKSNRPSFLKSQDNDTNGVNFANERIDNFNQLKIAFVTGNEMKAKEVNLILAEEQATKGPTPETSLVDLKIVNVDLPEIQEINTEAIAKNKAILGAQLVGGPCVVEDTSLQFNALGGMVSFES
jgi:hypothetical protein